MIDRRSALLSGVLLAAAGCAGSPPSPPVALVWTGVAVHDPVWSNGAVFALTEGGSRVARIEPGRAATLSPPLPGIGRNLVANPMPGDTLLVPQPGRDTVAVLAAGDLRPVSTVAAGPSPAYVDVVKQAKVLLAMPADGSEVSAVDLSAGTPLPPQAVAAGPGATVDGPARGRPVSFFVAGPSGIAYYKGSAGPVTRRAASPVRAAVSTGDLVKVSRLYVGEAGTGRLLAVETNPDENRLDVTATLDLGAPAQYLGVDQDRVFALTGDRLVVARTSNYEGYADGRFSVLTTIDLRAALPAAVRAAPFAGLTVGADRVYVAVAGEPFLLSVAKPGL